MTVGQILIDAFYQREVVLSDAIGIVAGKPDQLLLGFPDNDWAER